jgi:hypothetical protein
LHNWCGDSAFDLGLHIDHDWRVEPEELPHLRRGVTCQSRWMALNNARKRTAHHAALDPAGEGRTVENWHFDRVLHSPGEGRELVLFGNDGADVRMLFQVRFGERYKLFAVTMRVDTAEFALTGGFGKT